MLLMVMPAQTDVRSSAVKNVLCGHNPNNATNFKHYDIIIYAQMSFLCFLTVTNFIFARGHKLPSKTTMKPRFFAWFCLGIAILLEVTGTTFMAEAARNDQTWGYGVMALALAVSYYLLSRAIQAIPVGIGYAIWEAVGLILLAVVGVFIFHESLSLIEIAGIVLAIVGIVLVTAGEERRK